VKDDKTFQARWIEIPMGRAFRPLHNSQDYCDEHFEVGEVVTLKEVRQKSDAARNHFFACVGKAWENLKEGQFASQEHFRHWVVVQAGYYTCRDIAAMSSSHASRMAVEIGQLVHSYAPYAIITVRGNAVRVYQARSLSGRAPDALTKAEFDDMHAKALMVMSDMIGTDVAELLRQGAQEPVTREEMTAEPVLEPDVTSQHYAMAEPQFEIEPEDSLLAAYEQYARR